MRGSMEIPDAVVSRAADAYRDNLERDAFGDVGDDQRFDAMRFALVAARPYLMPTRQQVNKAMQAPLALDAVMALLNGAES